MEGIIGMPEAGQVTEEENGAGAGTFALAVAGAVVGGTAPKALREQNRGGAALAVEGVMAVAGGVAMMRKKNPVSTRIAGAVCFGAAVSSASAEFAGPYAALLVPAKEEKRNTELGDEDDRQIQKIAAPPAEITNHHQADHENAQEVPEEVPARVLAPAANG